MDLRKLAKKAQRIQDSYQGLDELIPKCRPLIKSIMTVPGQSISVRKTSYKEEEMDYAVVYGNFDGGVAIKVVFGGGDDISFVTKELLEKWIKEIKEFCNLSVSLIDLDGFYDWVISTAPKSTVEDFTQILDENRVEDSNSPEKIKASDWKYVKPPLWHGPKGVMDQEVWDKAVVKVTENYTKDAPYVAVAAVAKKISAKEGNPIIPKKDRVSDSFKLEDNLMDEIWDELESAVEAGGWEGEIEGIEVSVFLDADKDPDGDSILVSIDGHTYTYDVDVSKEDLKKDLEVMISERLSNPIIPKKDKESDSGVDIEEILKEDLEDKINFNLKRGSYYEESGDSSNGLFECLFGKGPETFKLLENLPETSTGGFNLTKTPNSDEYWCVCFDEYMVHTECIGTLDDIYQSVIPNIPVDFYEKYILVGGPVFFIEFTTIWPEFKCEEMLDWLESHDLMDSEPWWNLLDNR